MKKLKEMRIKFGVENIKRLSKQARVRKLKCIKWNMKTKYMH